MSSWAPVDVAHDQLLGGAAAEQHGDAVEQLGLAHQVPILEG